MAKVLIGAVIEGTKVEAKYEVTAFGTTKTMTKNTGWSVAVEAARAAFIAAIQAEADAAGLGTVIGAQVYTPKTDGGAPGFTGPGETVDINFPVNHDPRSIRLGDDEVVPTGIAAARDAFKAAVEASL